MTITVGIVSPGFMGSGLAWSLRRGGVRTVATVAGRSARTARLAAEGGLELLADLDAVVAASQIVLSVTPPAEAVDAATRIAEAAGRTGAAPLVADLNATSPVTMSAVADILARAGVDVVDGAISGPPPTEQPGASIYLSGPRAAEIGDLPWPDVTARVVGRELGRASAVKMCTASIYKGTTALLINALITADANGVLPIVLADLKDRANLAVVASSATKAHRFVAEMREIAGTQAAAGLSADLFHAIAEIWAATATTLAADGDPESIGPDQDPAELLSRLRTGDFGAAD